MEKAESNVRPTGELVTVMKAGSSEELLPIVRDLMSRTGFHGQADPTVSRKGYGDATLYGAAEMLVVHLIGLKPHQLILTGVDFGEETEKVRATAKLLAVLGFGDESQLYEKLSWPSNPDKPGHSIYMFRRH